MSYRTRMIALARQCTKQEVSKSITDPTCTEWRVASQMPEEAYWKSLEPCPSDDWTITGDNQGRVTIIRQTVKPNVILWDIRRFSKGD